MKKNLTAVIEIDDLISDDDKEFAKRLNHELEQVKKDMIFERRRILDN